MNGLEKTTKKSPVPHNLLPNLEIQKFQVNGSCLLWFCHCHWLGTRLRMSGHGPLPWEAPDPTGEAHEHRPWHPCEQGAHRLMEDDWAIPQGGRR